MNEQSSSILLVGDFPVLAEALTALFGGDKGFSVRHTPATGGDPVGAAEELQPDLIVLDTSLQRSVGQSFIRALRMGCPATPILVLSAHRDAFFVDLCFEAGAVGFATKHDSAEELVEAVEGVLRGEYFVSANVRRRENLQFVEEGPPRLEPIEELLTEREQLIMRRLGEGYSNAEIADMLQLSRKTIQIQQIQIKKKLRLRSAFDLSQLAIRMFDRTLDYSG